MASSVKRLERLAIDPRESRGIEHAEGPWQSIYLALDKLTKKRKPHPVPAPAE